MLFYWMQVWIGCVLVHNIEMSVYASVAVLHMPLSQCCIGQFHTAAHVHTYLLLSFGQAPSAAHMLAD